MIRMAAILAVTSIRPHSVCGMLAVAHSNIPFTNCLDGQLAALERPRETSEGHLAGTRLASSRFLRTYPKHLQQAAEQGDTERERERGGERAEEGDGWGRVAEM